MPELLTFGALKASDVPDIAGVCATSDTFRNYVNRATRMLLNRDAGQAAFWGTVEKLMACYYNNCIVWPRYVGTVLAVNVCKRPTSVWNNWYQFTPLSLSDFCSGTFSLRDGHCYGNVKVVNDGVSPVFNPIACGSQFYVRAYPSTQEDIGKTTTIYGIDENGQTIRTQQPDKTWREGITLTLAVPFVSTPIKIREITRITKDETQGVLRYYQYDADNDVLLDLVWYDPGETTPMYRRSKIYGTRPSGSCCATSCDGARSLEALVSLEFVPVKYDTDLVQISNQDALRNMISAMKYSDAGETAKATQFEIQAIRELNLEASRRFPKEQTPVTINPFGSAIPSLHRIGRIL